ncbi:Dyp-type peroxidase [Frankia sp. Cppng1_Ct_nod]|uniref:Dyp-type peroxidase n=1 Tax=Frankia sp. Cppng1_Ct_nod TaxID=2897162 RepID=UPI0010418CBC
MPTDLTSSTVSSAPTTPPVFPDRRPVPKYPKLRTDANIQGNILAGFNKDHQVILFLRLPADPVAARGWLAAVVPQVARNDAVTQFNTKFAAMRNATGSDPEALKAVWLNLSLTTSGLARLDPAAAAGLGAAGIDRGVTAFVQGTAAHAAQLGDSGDDAPANWLFGRDDQTIDVLLVVATDDRHDLDHAVQRQRELASVHDVLVVFEQPGATLPGIAAGHEHFGFKDGISQPGVSGYDKPSTVPGHTDEVAGKPGTDLIAPGEFVLGYVGQPGGVNATGRAVPRWMWDGSFLVVRRLAQDVPGWWAQIESQHVTLTDAVKTEISAEALAAKAVGRWRSGTPVDQAPKADDRFGSDPMLDNDFDFADDAEGLRCPRFAHIRKMYPRSAPPPSPGEDAVNQRRILRRGIPFGLPFDPTSGRGEGIDARRGLVFACYQTSLADQFEFLQQFWADNVTFPAPSDGPDPVIGTPVAFPSPPGAPAAPNPPDPRNTLHADAVTTAELTFNRFIRTEGSIYGFTPSLSTLRKLVAGQPL